MTDKEPADQLDAEKRLRSLGHSKHVCQRCGGSGIIRPTDFAKVLTWPCLQCDGKGYRWLPPLQRLHDALARYHAENPAPKTTRLTADELRELLYAYQFYWDIEDDSLTAKLWAMIEEATDADVPPDKSERPTQTGTEG